MNAADYGLTTGVIPVGDWEYQQAIDGGLHQCKAQDFEGLVAEVLRFRIDNNLTIGDAAADVADYTRRKSPQNDLRRKAGGQFQPAQQRPITPLAERMKHLLHGLNNKQVAKVDIDEANRRAAICDKCPQNIKWESTCSSCNEDIRYRSNLLRGRTSFPYDEKLRGCRLHALNLQSAVFMADNLPARDDKAPGFCWLT